MSFALQNFLAGSLSPIGFILHTCCAINSINVRVGLPAIPRRKYGKSIPLVVMTLYASTCIHSPQGTNSRKKAAALHESPPTISPTT